MKPSPNCFLCWWIVPWASPTPRYVTRNWNCHRLDRTVHWFHSFVIFSDFAEEFKFFTDQVRPALGSVGCFGWFWPCSGSHIYRHICLNHQETDQTNPMAPWDSLDVPIDPLKPLRAPSTRVTKTPSARQQCWPESFCKSGKFLRHVHYWLKNIRILCNTKYPDDMQSVRMN